MRFLLLPTIVLVLNQSVFAQVWEKIPGITEGMFSIGTNAQNDDAVWVGGNSRIYISYDQGISIADSVLIPFPTGAITTIFIHPVDTSLVIVGSVDGCHVSRDAGITWNHALPDTNVFLIGDSIALEPGTSDTLYIALFRNRQDSSETFFRSTDKGESWTAFPSPLGEKPYRFCAIVATGSNRLLAGRQFSAGVYVSNNGGETWSPSYIHPDTLIEVPAVVLDKSRPGGVWATILTITDTTGYVVYSESNGDQWDVIPLEGNPWGLDTDLNGSVYVGFFGTGAAGASISNNLGMTWTHNAAGFPAGSSGFVWMLKTSNDGSVLYSADEEFGAYRLDLTGGPTSAEGRQTGRAFVAPRNYPNPFNPTTTIQFALPERRRVNITLYNILGQQVAEIFNAELEAGVHNVPFQASGLPSGVYVYRLRAGDFVKSERMVLSK